MKEKSITSTILLSAYLIYMFRFFKTVYSIHHPYEFAITNKIGTYFEHPIKTGKYQSKICRFGKQAVPCLVVFLLLRYFIDIPKKVSWLVFFTVVLLSLLNMNAVLYLIPYFILEIIYLTGNQNIEIDVGGGEI